MSKSPKQLVHNVMERHRAELDRIAFGTGYLLERNGESERIHPNRVTINHENNEYFIDEQGPIEGLIQVSVPEVDDTMWLERLVLKVDPSKTWHPAILIAIEDGTRPVVEPEDPDEEYVEEWLRWWFGLQDERRVYMETEMMPTFDNACGKMIEVFLDKPLESALNKDFDLDELERARIPVKVRLNDNGNVTEVKLR